MKCIKFDGTFDPNDFTDEVTELKQWVELLIKVEKDKYKIYNENFGMDFSDIVGYRLPRSIQVSEIIRRLKKVITNGCEHVTDCRDFQFDNGIFKFAVVTDLGKDVIISV